MSIRNDLDAVHRALRAAPPYALAETVRDALLAHTAAQDVDLLLADYALVALRHAVEPPPPGTSEIRIDSSAAGRAFASRQPQWEQATGTLHLPVTAFGERFGVLSVRLPAPPESDEVRELQDVAGVLVQTLRGADRLTDRYQRARRLTRLTLAAETQWELLPGNGHRGNGYQVAGQLEPAYAVYGDNFDWSCGPDSLELSITNGMGEGMRAALLTTLAVTALRNARRSGASLEEQAGLADEAVYSQYRGREYVSTLLLRFDATTGVLSAIEAGSPRILRLRGTGVETIELDQQLPLGMFGSTAYTEQSIALRPGDRLVIVSDGMYGSRSAAGTEFGEASLDTVVRSTRLQPADEAVRSMIRGMLGFREGMDVVDDAVVVCLDWTVQEDAETPPP
ncbi:PP2C family protein-serine/threonine phosphatase [Nonomuraea endophytica]|uniref:Serine phosphatase RsbU (Regulator of sigma subunit) n=1 Tax=Nonomuraea endophytica TaxID=714136 RepID=A0A7W8EMK2_9ACTN|nr:PP2C family protein-serine/threonine phosphatase [Nonomuraea endophytica]MBB5084042.1 serine phosphatase RsbU (regulator of sigma subunit) [Nonomuraea endophytica]